MLSDDQESCTSPNSQDFGQVTSTIISPQPTSITAGDITTGQPESTIDMLLDEVLLEIFTYYVESQRRDAWHTLACVCRRWRSIAFGSPRRLNLRIFCSGTKPVRKNLDSWPPFPIVLTSDSYTNSGEENILATLEHHDHICQIEIWDLSSSLWEKVLPLMQKPFPILRDLSLWYTDRMTSSVIPDSFLGGSATRLRRLSLKLTGILFPGLPKLLLSATHLVHLKLGGVPDSGFIALEAMVTCLSALTRLESLRLGFKSSQPRPEWERRRTSPPTRALLPSLTSFTFGGASEYLEDIVDRIDTPLLDSLRTKLFYQPIFDTPRLAQFIGRVPKFKTCNEARIRLERGNTCIKVLSPSKTTTNASVLLRVLGRQRDFPLSSSMKLCTSSFPRALISTVEGLIIVDTILSRPLWQDGIIPSLWRELLQPFTAVKDLYLSAEIAPHIGLFLQELVGECVLEHLPALQSIFLEGLQPWELVPEGIKQFVAARQLASHPISVSSWERQISLTW